MSSVKISQLPAASPLTGPELTPVVQGGITKQAPVSALSPIQVTNETPSGPINGTNTAYTLANTPLGGVMLFYNGILLEPGAGNDYTLTGAAITMAYALLTGAKLRAYYQHR